MREIIATFSVNVDVEDGDDDESIQEQARWTMIDLLKGGAEVDIEDDQ